MEGEYLWSLQLSRVQAQRRMRARKYMSQISPNRIATLGFADPKAAHALATIPIAPSPISHALATIPLDPSPISHALSPARPRSK